MKTNSSSRSRLLVVTLEQISEVRQVHEVRDTAVILSDLILNQPAQNDGGTARDGYGRRQPLTIDDRDLVSGDVNIAAERVINLRNFKRDFVVGINQRNHFKPEFDIFVADGGSNRSAIAVINYATCGSSCKIAQRTRRHWDTLTTGNDGSLVVCGVNCRACKDFEIAAAVECSNKYANGIADRTVNGQALQRGNGSRGKKPSRVPNDLSLLAMMPAEFKLEDAMPLVPLIFLKV